MRDRPARRHVGVPLDINALEADMAVVAGLDRYETVTWRMVHDGARGYGLRVRGRPKASRPPASIGGARLMLNLKSPSNWSRSCFSNLPSV